MAGSAIALGLAGVGLILNGSLTHLGIVLLIEAGVLVTLVTEKLKPARGSQRPSV